MHNILHVQLEEESHYAGGDNCPISPDYEDFCVFRCILICLLIMEMSFPVKVCLVFHWSTIHTVLC